MFSEVFSSCSVLFLAHFFLGDGGAGWFGWYILWGHRYRLDSGGSLSCWLLWALWSLIYAGIHVRCIGNLSSWERPGISFLKFQHSCWRINVILEMFSFLLLSRRQLIATNVFWITIIIFQSCQPLAVKVGSWDYGHKLWRLELQFRKQILHSALGLARTKLWSPLVHSCTIFFCCLDGQMIHTDMNTNMNNRDHRVG